MLAIFFDCFSKSKSLGKDLDPAKNVAGPNPKIQRLTIAWQKGKNSPPTLSF